LTRQIFWQPFDTNNIDGLKKQSLSNNNNNNNNNDNNNNDDDNDCGIDIGVCKCRGSFAKKLYESRELLSSTKISDSSPLKSLKDSGVIDKEALDYYAILESVMHNCNMDPATVLTTSREKSNAVRFVKSSLPDLGQSVVVVHSNNNNDDDDDDNNNNFVTPTSRPRQQLKRSKGVAFEETNDNEMQQLMQPLKHLKKTPTTTSSSSSPSTASTSTAFLVAITKNGDQKKQSSCSICGVEGAKQTTHLHANHGYRKTLPQEDLKKWYATLGTEDREKLFKVTK